MKVHILVEGASERAFLEPWTKRFLKGHEVRVHPHQGKGTLPIDPESKPNPKNRGLLHRLPATLRAFNSSLDRNNEGVLVLVDADNDDCRQLKLRIASVAHEVSPDILVEVRIAVEETESFYLGDQRAITTGFPSADLSKLKGYAPDEICGAWELFGKVIDDGGENKVAWAEAMGSRLTTDPKKNLSPSFRALCRAFVRLVAPRAIEKKRKSYRHPSKTDKKRR